MEEAVPTVLRLVTGEDIIADTVYYNEAGNAKYIVSDPLKIIYLPVSKETHISLSLMQWVFTRISENQTFEIKEQNVLFTTDPSDSLTQYYYKTVEYFYEIKEANLLKTKASQEKLKNDLYEEFAMSDDEELNDMIEGDELDKLNEILDHLSKKNRGSLH